MAIGYVNIKTRGIRKMKLYSSSAGAHILLDDELGSVSRVCRVDILSQKNITGFGAGEDADNAPVYAFPNLCEWRETIPNRC